MKIPTIKKSHKLVLLAACLFAAGSTVFMLALKPAAPKNTMSYHCFKTERGWGYDVLINETILIHQPFIPELSGYVGYNSEQQAADSARIVIEKIKSGEIPLLSRQQLQRLGVLRTQSK
jgi:hypothetical protein